MSYPYQSATSDESGEDALRAVRAGGKGTASKNLTGEDVR